MSWAELRTDKAQGADIVAVRRRKTAPLAASRTSEKEDSTTRDVKTSKQQYRTTVPGAARPSRGTAPLCGEQNMSNGKAPGEDFAIFKQRDSTTVL